MIYPSRRLCRQSISSQIRGNNGEPPGEIRGNFAPHNVRLRGAVKEKKRRSITTHHSVNRGATAVNRMGSESRKEGCCLAPNRSQLTLRSSAATNHDLAVLGAVSRPLGGVSALAWGFVLRGMSSQTCLAHTLFGFWAARECVTSQVSWMSSVTEGGGATRTSTCPCSIG